MGLEGNMRHVGLEGNMRHEALEDNMRHGIGGQHEAWTQEKVAGEEPAEGFLKKYSLKNSFLC